MALSCRMIKRACISFKKLFKILNVKRGEIKMRKIIVTTNITLDGVMQGTGGPEEDRSGDFKYGGWAAPYADQISGMAVQKDMKDNNRLSLGQKNI